MWHEYKTRKTFSNDTKVDDYMTLRLWPLFLKIAKLMSKLICGKTYNIGYTFWGIRERNSIFGTHTELKKN